MCKAIGSKLAVIILVIAALAVVDVVGVSQPHVSISGKSDKVSLTLTHKSVSVGYRVGAGLCSGTLSIDSKGAVEGCWAPGYGLSLGKQAL